MLLEHIEFGFVFFLSIYIIYFPGTLEYDLALLQLKEEPILRKIKNIGLIALPSKAVGQLWPHTNQVRE